MSKKNVLLGGILIVLVLALFIKEGPLKNWQEKRDKTKNILAGVAAEQISRIDIAFQGEETSLEKVGDSWRVAGTKDFYLNGSLVNTVSNALVEAVRADLELVSANPEKKDEFAASAGTGAAVRLSQGAIILKEFVVGNTGPDFQSTYISMEDIDETYLIKAPLNGAFWRNDWYDREIFNLDSEAIAKIRFQYPNREFTVEKGEDGWSGTLPYAFSVDAEKLEPVLNIMSGLYAFEVPPQIFAGTGLEKNLIIIQASGEGFDNVLMVGESTTREGGDDDSEEELTLYYAKRGNSDNIYLINQSQRDELDKQIRDLR